MIKEAVKKLLRYKTSPKSIFFSYHYQRHNQRRLEHLASLGLDIAGSSVLEVGAGIGDHTSFFLDRGCRVVTSDARKDNVEILRSRYPDVKALAIDLDNPPKAIEDTFDIVYCYGLLYHLKNPIAAVEFLSQCCRKILLLETCVSFDNEDSIDFVEENMANPSQALSGQGCRPSRRWLYNRLKERFEFVYLPVTQPNHDEFPIDWTLPPQEQQLMRAVFIASRQKISNPVLTEELPMRQVRH